MRIYVLVITIIVTACVSAQADDSDSPDFHEAFIELNLEGSPCSRWELCDKFNDHRFQQFRDNDFSYRLSPELELGGESVQEDESALRGSYSLRYVFWEHGCNKVRFSYGKGSKEYLDCLQEKKTEGKWSTRIFLGMTGVFDFYVGTRYSGPVINRVSNPGVYIERFIPYSFWGNENERPDPFRSFQVGLEHRSDGQVREVYDDDGNAIPSEVEEVVNAYNNNDQHVLDTLSQGANFLSLRWIHDFIILSWDSENRWSPVENVGYEVGFKLYIQDYGTQVWKDNPDLGFAGYDLLDASVTGRELLGLPLMGELGFRLGTEGLDGISYDASLTFDICPFNTVPIPLQVKFHQGPMDYLAYYSVSTTSIGLGLNLGNLVAGRSCVN